MRYHGGKSRLGSNISEIILQVIDSYEILGYIEPFCGMCGVMSHVAVKSDLFQYFAFDNNVSVIKMWKELQTGWEPDIIKFDEDRFNLLKGNGESTAEKGFFGHAMTFGALYFQVFRPELKRLLQFSKDDVLKRIHNMKDVTFLDGDYKQTLHYNLKNYVIYCDPPYKRRSRYYDENNKKIDFDSDEFWKTCDKLSTNNVIVISEHEDFLESKCKNYTGTFNILKLPSRFNTFGKTSQKSGEFVCIITRLIKSIEP